MVIKSRHAKHGLTGTGSTTTDVEMKSITPRDVVIETKDGRRQPAMPVQETDVEVGGSKGEKIGLPSRKQVDESVPPSRTHPLFPPLPIYGPPSLIRSIQCTAFRFSSFFLSLAFLGMIVAAASVSSFAVLCQRIWIRLTFRNPDAGRPFREEEIYRRRVRREAEREWKRRKHRGQVDTEADAAVENPAEYKPSEGGVDPVICDIGYYARRVGLDVETFRVQTEDGFVITLWHVYDPREYVPASERERGFRGPDVFTTRSDGHPKRHAAADGKRKYPVLLIHGLLQSAGAYCTNDDESLAFFLCKSGYDVWLGNNRCGFHPEHTNMAYSDPRMWAWNIRQMGVLDLPALVSRVLFETGFEKLGLVCHSQGTTQALVAFSKGQRPDLGQKISVFCGLAPAAYAGPLIGKVYFKFMRIISPTMFRLIFGIHAFIPLMMTMHGLLPGRLYGVLGYQVFSFLFNWSDTRWDRDLRDRMFQFAPVYVSAESMRWWLGRKCFARHKCILATKEQWRREETEDRLFVEAAAETAATLLEKSRVEASAGGASSDQSNGGGDTSDESSGSGSGSGSTPDPKARSASAWYDDQTPPFAFWVAGSDDLVDGRRLLRRFENGREPHVRVVHAEVIEEYEHLDVIWAMDSIEKVGKGVRDVIWRTVPEGVRDSCRVPRGVDS
ncbi:hypothetical protein FQN54_009258 [Arachnomyces sp. PD_36]|nr:hypothetical protein FQN54_009258 [Arachnomyces sp. PD_36]